MRWKWAALLLVLIACGVYLFVGKVLVLSATDHGYADLYSDGDPNDKPVATYDEFRSKFSSKVDIDDGDSYSIVRPKLLDIRNYHINNENSYFERNNKDKLKDSSIGVGDKIKLITKRSVNENDIINNVLSSPSTTSIDNGDINLSIDRYSYYLYRMNVFGHDVVVNLTRFETNSSLSRNSIFAPNFILQHLDTNYTWIKKRPVNKTVDSVNRCLFTGKIIENSTWKHPIDAAKSGSILLNLCRGMYGMLQLPQGTYFLEPLLGNTSRGDDDELPPIPDDQPHLLYRHRSHTFHNYSTSQRHVHPNSHQRNATNDDTNDYDNRHSAGQRFTFAHPGHHRRRKRSTSFDHYVEVLVVADAQMRHYHRDNLENYILTLLSIVATIYRHPSLEAALNIVVVRLIVIDHENAGPLINENAQETLKQFCRWQQSLNDDDDDSINHHDVAILLTRHDICRAPGKCDTLGLAELGTMCDFYRSCAIIEDNGLSAAFTIAHELGHIFNVPHDDEKKCSQYMSLDKDNFHIMAPTLEYNTHPWSWSQCSSSLLRNFLDSPKAWCLFDKPIQQTYVQQMITNPTPGLNFTVHQQCKYVFGPASELCPFMPPCKRLWCTNVYSFQYEAGCRTQHMPWADGTPCAYNKWCYRGECMAVSPDQLTPVDGAWGNWKDWGDCSRTCGGGVEKATRDCDSPRPTHGGKYCVGQRARYRSCNLKECPGDITDFREVQCATYNGNKHKIPSVGTDVKWLPKYDDVSPNDRCKLYCTVDGGSAFYLLKNKVVDGTPCGRDSDNICVNGVCYDAGCDGQLGSDLKRDECGVCNGNGKTCRKETGNFNGQTSYGYNSLLKIPAGVNHIDIRQSSWNNRNDDDNYLALLNSKGEFILNGHFQVSVFRQQIRVKGTILEYSGSDAVVERINSSRPVQEDLFVHILAVGQLKPPHVDWEYMMNDKSLLINSQISHEWRLTEEWSACDNRCHGSQIQKLICIQLDDGKAVSDNLCETVRRPDVRQRVCNMHCQLKWHAEILVECSATCGQGEIIRKPYCVEEQTSNGRSNQRVDDHHCLHIDRPLDKIQCYKDCAGRRWVYSDWQTCSNTCNGGTQKRHARCEDQTNQVLDDRYCQNLKLENTEQNCNEMPCPSWHYGDWAQCSHSCDSGVQARVVTCRDASSREIDSRLCDIKQRLEEHRKCNEHLCTKWKFGTWSECSQTCGDAVSNRQAQCVDNKDNHLDESQCIANQKLVTKPCKLQPCPRWRLGEWSPCSRTCMNGWNSRRVECIDSDQQPLELKMCGKDIPPAHQPCNHGPCPFWRAQDWSPCSVTCGVGHQERSVDCVYSDDVVDLYYCKDLEEPVKKQSCSLSKCPEWDVGQWDTCSSTCGEGSRRRNLHCIQTDNRQQVDFQNCDQATKPITIEKCVLVACSSLSTTKRADSSSVMTTVFMKILTTSTARSVPTVQPLNLLYREPSTVSARYRVSKHSTAYALSSQSSPTRWEMGAWTECSVTCGEGQQMRYVACRDVFYRILPDIYCSHEDKPENAQTCVRNTCGEWHFGDWQPCPVTCGAGFETTRQVTCVAPASENVLEWSYCDPVKRPASERPCNLSSCYDRKREDNDNNIENDILQSNSWRVGEWGQCSQTCGGGWQQRLVVCVPGFGPGPVVYCRVMDKPIALRPCSRHSCPRWLFGDWGQCNRTCGGGYQERIVECVNPDDGRLVGWENCSDAAMPDRYQSCNTHRCHHKYDGGRHGSWKLGKWSKCSSACGRGVQWRSVQCVDGYGNSSTNETHQCDNETKPTEQQNCRVGRCLRWKRGKWSSCSVSCGEGIRNRQVYCIQGRKNIVSNKKCGNLTKPPDTSHCRLSACPTYRWITSKWSKCSQQCGNGRQYREVNCVNNLQQKSPPIACNYQKRPSATQSCISPKCPYSWVPGPWTTCSKTCDEGAQYRSLQCQLKGQFVQVYNMTSTNREGEGGYQVPSHYCKSLPKPKVSWSCSLGACESDTFWKTDPWSHCSVTCGWGYQQRKIYCFAKNETRVARENCVNKTSQLRPQRRRRCFTRNCDPANCAEVKEILNATVDSLYDILVGGRTVKIFCHGMNSSSPVEYLPLPTGGRTNYAEFYGKRLMYPFSCPYNGSRNESCYCTENASPKPGLTRFAQIRIDLINMKLNTMDDLYSSVEFGAFVPYATAGDCYSAVNCPQGRFSIDLRGTGFKVSEKTVWKEDGHRVSVQLSRLENGAMVQGLCGGYCGKCYPDKKIGLEIELDSEHFSL